MDGCTLTGGPDNKDKIIDCDVQTEIYPLVREAIGLVEELIEDDDCKSHDDDSNDDHKKWKKWKK